MQAMSAPSTQSILNEESAGQQLQTPYIGSRLSLISNSDIRYEGILYSVNTKEATIALAKVRSFGTEDRETSHAVAAVYDVFEYIIFKATDIKDLIMCESPQQTEMDMNVNPLKDPAIVSMSQPEKNKSKSSSPDFTSSGQSNRSSHVTNASGGGGMPHLWPSVLNGARASMSSPAFHSNSYNPNQHYGGGARASASVPLVAPPPLFPPMQRYLPHRSSPNNGRGGGNGQFRQRNVNAAAKFDTDYDFEQANQQFKRSLDKLSAQKCSDKHIGEDNSDTQTESVVSSPQSQTAVSEPLTYDKQRSFFDTISCDPIDRNSQRALRLDRRVNTETFGQSAIRRSPGRLHGGVSGRDYGYGGRAMYNGGGGGGRGPWMMPPPHVMWQYMQAMQHAHLPPPSAHAVPFQPRGRFAH